MLPHWLQYLENWWNKAISLFITIMLAKLTKRLRHFPIQFGLIVYSMMNCFCLWLLGAGLGILQIDLQKTANRMAHHTNEYEHKKLIVRRGQPFNITVTFDRHLDLNEDKVTLQLVFGEFEKMCHELTESVIWEGFCITTVKSLNVCHLERTIKCYYLKLLNRSIWYEWSSTLLACLF